MMSEVIGKDLVLPAPLPPEILHQPSEAEKELAEADARIVVLQDELAVLQETHYPDGPRTNEMVVQESRIAKRKLLIVAQQYLRKELLEEIEEDAVLLPRIYSPREQETEA